MAMHTAASALQATLTEIEKGKKEYAVNLVRVSLAVLTDSEVWQDLIDRDSIDPI